MVFTTYHGNHPVFLLREQVRPLALSLLLMSEFLDWLCFYSTFLVGKMKGSVVHAIGKRGNLALVEATILWIAPVVGGFFADSVVGRR